MNDNYNKMRVASELHSVYSSLKIMDMLLYKYAYEPQTVASFQSTEDMAKYYREFLHVILPEEYQYQKEENCE
jgi:hypothetical protein